MSAFIDFHDLGVVQLGQILGIPAVAIAIWMQLRSYRKDQRKQAEDNRLAITTEINDKSQILYERIEARLEAIKVAAVVTKDDITVLKVQINDLRRYIDELDKSGTVEWQKTKPFLIERIAELDKRIDEINSRFTFKMTEIAKTEIKKDKTVK